MRPISISDDQLLACPDSQAFGDFYARHAQGVRRYFVRRTADVELAADLTSETFAAALKARDRFRPGGAPATAWLYTIAARRLIDHRRRAAGEHRMRIDLVADSDRAGLEDEHPAQLGVDAVGVGLLGRLPPDQRAAVRSHVLAGFGYAEIAEAAGTSEAAVRQRVSRGLATLRGPLRAFRKPRSSPARTTRTHLAGRTGPRLPRWARVTHWTARPSPASCSNAPACSRPSTPGSRASSQRAGARAEKASF